MKSIFRVLALLAVLFACLMASHSAQAQSGCYCTMNLSVTPYIDGNDEWELINCSWAWSWEGMSAPPAAVQLAVYSVPNNGSAPFYTILYQWTGNLSLQEYDNPWALENMATSFTGYNYNSDEDTYFNCQNYAQAMYTWQDSGGTWHPSYSTYYPLFSESYGG